MAAPLIEYLKVQRSTELAILAMLRHAERSVSPELTMIEGMGDLSVSQKIKRAQLAHSRAAIHQAIDHHFAAVGGEIRGRRSEVAEVAGRTVAEAAEIFKVAGLNQTEIKTMQQSMIASAQSGVEAAMARAQGKSYVPLSKRVYKTAALAKGQVSHMINDHLARGSSARELAADVRRFVKPEVRGGMRYASMRLARTELNNAFHAVSIDQAKKNSFVIGMTWHVSGSHPRPDQCNDYDQQFFKPHEVPPKPHPNCFCYVTPETPSPKEFLDQYNKGEHTEAPPLAGDHSPLAPSAVDSKGKPFGADVVAAANRTHAQASKAAEKITADLQSHLPKGAELTGLEYRLKTPESLAVKIRADSTGEKISPATAASGIFDSVRYTQLSSPDRMAADASHMLNRLRASGYEVTQVKNTWENTTGNPYYGVNVKLRDKQQQIELQFHTPESLEVKNKLHGLYDKQKLAAPQSPEWHALNNEMLAMSGGMTVPKNVHSIR